KQPGLLYSRPGSGGSSGDLKSDIERSCVPLCLTGDLKDQLVSAAPEDAIHSIKRGPTAPAGVGGLQVNFIRDRFFEVQLRCKLVSPSGRSIRADLKVNVNGSARIPTGIDRDELGRSIGVRDLITTEELFTAGVK